MVSRMKSKIHFSIPLVLILIALVLSVVSAHAASNSENGFWIVVKGESMSPTLHNDSWAFVEKIPFKDVKQGQIVVRKNIMGYFSPVIHRTTKFQSGLFGLARGWITQGDNTRTNPHADRGLMTEENYVGVVTDTVLIK